MLLGLALACVSGPPVVGGREVEGGIEVTGDRPLTRVVVTGDDGLPLASIAPSAPTPVVLVPVTLPRGGRATILAEVAGGAVALTQVTGAPGPVRVEIEVPEGQGRRPVADGETIEVATAPGRRAALVLTALEAGPVSVDGVEVGPLAVGERRVLPLSLDGPREVGVGAHRFTLRPRPLDPEAADRALSVVGVTLPADPLGRPDPTLPPDRLVISSGPGWAPLRALGFGWRPRPDQAPWTWQAVTLRNSGAAPLDLVLRGSVVDAAGAPVPAFRSRVRDQEGLPSVSVLLRVPADRDATAALPLFVDPARVAPGVYTARVEVLALGDTAPLRVIDRPLAVGGGGRAAGPAFTLSLLASALGWGWLATAGGRRLRALPTADLVTVSLFGALTFVVGAAFQLVGFAVAALLGPLAPLVTAIPDDAFRACLLATLVTLIPRPGVVAAATLVGFGMRALALGSLHPADLLYVGTAVALHEGALWLVGLTRSGDWRDQSATARWLRLSCGLGLANALSVGLGLAATAVLYRLYYAGWYVGLLIGGPGLLYVVLGCRLAVPFAASLRRVSP